MSTSAALPAGASIVSISGKRCTVIPKTDTSFLNSIVGTQTVTSVATTAAAVTTAPPAAVAATTSTSAPAAVQTTSTTAAAAAIAPDIALSQATTSSSVTSPVTSSVAAPSSSSIPPSLPSSVSSSILSSTLPSSVLDALPSSTTSLVAAAVVSQASTTPLDIPSSSSTETVAAEATSTSITFPVAQSEISSQTTSTNDGTFSGTATTTPGSAQGVSSSAAGSTNTAAAVAASSSGSRMPVGAMVGGILGGFALIGIVSFILWFLRRRKRRRDSFLTPLGSEPGDLSRSTSPSSNREEPVSPVEKFRAQVSSTFLVLGSSVSKLKSRARGGLKNTVNMNRGNSQFLEPIPQHSRQNSALSGHQGKITMKDKFDNWYDRIKEDLLLKLRVNYSGKEKASLDPFAAAREKQAATGSATLNTSSPDFSQLLAMEERELIIAAEKRQQYLTRSSSLGSLGINFDNPANPFANPSNPFNDPANIVSAPKPSQLPSSNYIADVRRSRGQSVTQTPGSRYPSTYAPDRDSYGYRDTFMSSATNGRKTKGRSDPFDLEKLPLEATAPPMPNNARSGTEALNPRVISTADSEVSAAGTYSSKYSTGALSDWGDPGPDLGPGWSGLSNLKFGDLGGDTAHSRQDSDALGGTLRRNASSGSKGSVGKAI